MLKDNNFSFIIPTIGRYKSIKALLSSIDAQQKKPLSVIIIDSSSSDINFSLSQYSFPIDYIKTEFNSLTQKKNLGIKKAPKNCELIGFLDDDIVLFEGAVEAMICFWAQASNIVGGASFNVINFPNPKLMRIKEFFLIDSFTKGKVLKSGFGTSLYPAIADYKAVWLSGGNTLWRKDVLQRFLFDENLKGYSFAEDLDFSYRVGKNYDLFVVAKAKVAHFSDPIEKDKLFDYGKMEVSYRYHFLLKHKELSKISFFWAYLGLMFINMLADSRKFKYHYSLRSLGNFFGLWRVVFYKNKFFKENETNVIRSC